LTLQCRRWSLHLDRRHEAEVVAHQIQETSATRFPESRRWQYGGADGNSHPDYICHGSKTCG
jgi:hypothetical protein